MNIKTLKNAVFIIGISLLFIGCNDPQPEALQETTASQSETPETLPDTLKVNGVSKTFVITGIGLSGSNKVAIINNKVVTPGMKLDSGVVLKDIHSTYAIILSGKTEYFLRPENIQNELNLKKH